jgi:hypothetical protein
MSWTANDLLIGKMLAERASVPACGPRWLSELFSFVNRFREIKPAIPPITQSRWINERTFLHRHNLIPQLFQFPWSTQPDNGA